MSRHLSDVRDQVQPESSSSRNWTPSASGGGPRRESRELEGRLRDARSASVPIDRLFLPRGHERELVTLEGRTFQLRGSETRVLATVGAFRVVREDDLADGRGSDTLRADLRRLSNAGLLERRTIPINQELTRILALSEDGKRLLEAHRDGAGDRGGQEFHAGLVKRRELAHDAQVYGMYPSEAAAIEARGGRVLRVVLDAELKRDYQAFLNRPRDHTDPSREDDTLAFAKAQHLPVSDGHLQMPDLRIECEVDGRLERRDLELVTDHYSRAQVEAKARAGFAMFRSSGRNAGNRGTPYDPHHLRRFV